MSREVNEAVNIALIVGVSEYRAGNDLSAAEYDAQFVHDLLCDNGKYKDVFTLETNVSSVDFNKKMNEISSKYESVPIEEFFFYFSGHGYIANGEFIYCTSDFHTTKPRTSSIPNKDLDEWIKFFSPDLTVKVIDACHSGARVIKEQDIFSKSLISEGFNNFVQFASSMEEQYSFASSDVSLFTKVFLEAASLQKSEKILYRDIENYILDAFEREQEQTPYFITQSTRREIFCPDSTRLSEFHEKMVSLRNVSPKGTVREVDEKLLELASRYPSVEDAANNVAKFEQRFLSLEISNENLYKVYKGEGFCYRDYSDIPKSGTIAKSLAHETKDTPLVEIYSTQEQIEPAISIPFVSK